jgi:glycosyltransferase involved in cell wall biosynthesis
MSVFSKSQPSAQPRQVTILVSDLSTKGVGRWGGAVRTFLLAQALDRLGYRIQIVGSVFGELGTLPAPPHWQVVTVPGCPYPGYFRSIARLWPQITGDIIYAQKLKPSSYGLGLLKAIAHRRPVIVDIDDWELSWHGGDQYRYRLRPRKFLRDLLGKDGELRRPDHPLYLQAIEPWASQATAITVNTLALQQRFGGVLIPSGKDTALFDPNRFDPVAARSHQGWQDYKILMFPGATRPYKGVEDLLVALDQLNDPQIRLVIVGGSPYDDYDQQLQARWGRWLIYLPKQPASEMPAVVAAAHAVVVPQRDTPETRAQFPLKLTDGMAMGKPVIATRVGDIPQLLGDTGLLVEPSQPSQLAQAIRQVLDDPEQSGAIGRRARQRCIEHYSLEAMATGLHQILDRC